MSQTRRQTLVAVLRGTNGYSLNELNAMNAIVGSFLTEAANAGVTNGDLAEQLEAFKANGGSGLSSAITSIRKSGFGKATKAADAACIAAVENAKAALKQAQAALDAVSK